MEARDLCGVNFGGLKGGEVDWFVRDVGLKLVDECGAWRRRRRGRFQCGCLLLDLDLILCISLLRDDRFHRVSGRYYLIVNEVLIII